MVIGTLNTRFLAQWNSYRAMKVISVCWWLSEVSDLILAQVIISSGQDRAPPWDLQVIPSPSAPSS